MDLSDIQALSTPDKLQYLSTPDGIAQLKIWLSSLFIIEVADMLQISNNTFYRFRKRNPEIIAITKKPVATKVDLSRPPAYRLMVGYSYHYHIQGEVMSEYATPEALWQSDFICKYFKAFNESAMDYYEKYLTQINKDGIYQLSNTYCVVFCNITPSGKVKVLKPKLTEALQGTPTT